MIKAFISHSSQQKRFVEALVEVLGRTFCIVDEYDFEPAKKSKDEIFRNIRDADIFILLISKSALESDWVKIEIEKAKERADKGKIEIFPYIIDPDISFSNEKIPSWITEEEVFNLKTFTNVRILARDILHKQREIIYRLHPEIKERDELFVGRNSERGILETKLYTGHFNRIGAIIASGRNGIGRRKFLKKFTLSNLNYLNDPFDIDLSRGDNIENFILQLNWYLLRYNFDEFSWAEWSRDKKVSIAVELLNEAYKTKQHILITDDGACITSGGSIAEWFTDILDHPMLTNFIGLFVVSTITPKSHHKEANEKQICIELHPLSEMDRTNLFYAYSRSRDLEIDKDDVSFWVTKLHGSPEQIYIAVDSIKRNGRLIAKNNIDKIIALGDKSIKEIISYCNTKQIGELKTIDIVTLLAHLGPISDQFLLKIVGDVLKEDCWKIVEDLHYMSIIEFFGPSKECIKLDTSISDYIDRADYKLAPKFSEAIDQISKDYLSESQSSETEDLSDYLYRIQLSIRGGDYNSKNLIPSVAIKSIISLYNDKKYDSVISLCEGFLTEKNRIYPDAARELNYWLCMALARKLDHTRFNLAIEELTGLAKKFVKGFMCRMSNDLTSAEKLFREILTQQPLHKKAARELVTVLLKRRDYLSALNLARDNYSASTASTTNPYHIEAYYRCLVHKNNLTHDDRKVLETLIKAMKASYDDNRNIIAKTMEAEYQFYVNRQVIEPIQQLQEINKSLNNQLNYPVMALSEMQSKSGIPVTL